MRKVIRMELSLELELSTIKSPEIPLHLLLKNAKACQTYFFKIFKVPLKKRILAALLLTAPLWQVNSYHDSNDWILKANVVQMRRGINTTGTTPS